MKKFWMELSDKRKNTILLVGVVLSPFAMIALDWSVFKERSVYEAIVLPLLFEHWAILIPSYLIFLMWPSLIFLNHLSLGKRKKRIISFLYLSLLTPLAVVVSFVVGMAVKNVYP